MAQYMVMKNGTIRDIVNNLIIPNAEGNRDYRIFLLWKEGKDEFGNDLGTGPNFPDVEPSPTLEEAKISKIAGLKSMANSLLSQTDWYAIRNGETSVPIPEEVSSLRASLRDYTNTAETEINALSDVESVESYAFNFPTT